MPKGDKDGKGQVSVNQSWLEGGSESGNKEVSCWTATEVNWREMSEWELDKKGNLKSKNYETKKERNFR